MKCSGITKAGQACVFTALEGSDRCAQHSDPETRRRIMSERGRLGGEKTAKRIARRKRTSCSLRTVEDILAELEITVMAVQNGSGETCTKANAIARLVSTALDALKVGVLSEENARLKKFLAEKHPELAQRLGVKAAA
jgi:hypothetical protein